MKELFVCHEADIAEGTRKVVAEDGVEIGVFRVGGALVAWRNHCPHQGGPVCQGKVMKRVEEKLTDSKQSLGIHYVEGSLNVVYPWHGYEFDVRTGRHVGLDAVRLAAVPVKSRDGAVYVVVS